MQRSFCVYDLLRLCLCLLPLLPLPLYPPRVLIPLLLLALLLHELELAQVINLVSVLVVRDSLKRLFKVVAAGSALAKVIEVS